MVLKNFWNSISNLSQACYQILKLLHSPGNFLLNIHHGFFAGKQLKEEIQFNKFYISWLELLALLDES